MANALPTPDRPIVLVGPMGAGKTTIGRRLAERLGLPFADSDEEIERSAGSRLPEIFDRVGEAGFRDEERMAMRRLIEGGPKVIASGGGAFADGAMRALILERCVAIWLEADVATLAERVSRGAARPLLTGRDALNVLRELAEERGPAYAKAHLRVTNDAAPPERAVDRIVEALLQRARQAGDPSSCRT